MRHRKSFHEFNNDKPRSDIISRSYLIYLKLDPCNLEEIDF